eukprot:GHVU01209485.1.p1 GENE.GHVU01209485.1~~GHVU01209485.1.p1  ORF type:complete len:103 (+),score=9.18 GHVU01209485.1:539-847(+)
MLSFRVSVCLSAVSQLMMSVSGSPLLRLSRVVPRCCAAVIVVCRFVVDFDSFIHSFANEASGLTNPVRRRLLEEAFRRYDLFALRPRPNGKETGRADTTPAM